jgi:hypothetical protein
MEERGGPRVRIEAASSVRPVAVVARLHHAAKPGSVRAVDGSRNRMIAELGAAPTATAPAPVRAATPEELRALREAGECARAHEASSPAGRAAAAYLRAGAGAAPGRLFDIHA